MAISCNIVVKTINLNKDLISSHVSKNTNQDSLVTQNMYQNKFFQIA